MAIGTHYQKYLDDRMAMGFTAHEAAGMSGAIQAAEADRADLAQRQRSATTSELLGEDSNKGFANAQERRNAMSKRDAQGRKLYEVSEEYRNAVIHKIKLSSEEVCGLYRPEANMPKNTDMLQAAEEELYNAKRQDLFHRSASKDPVVSAQARYDLIQFHQDPANQEIMQRFENTYAEQHPLETEIRSLQAQGMRVGTSLQPTEAQIQNCEEHPFNAFAADEAGNIVNDVGVQ